MSKSDSNLDLHEAMVLLLLEEKHRAGEGVLTTTALAKGVNARRLYWQVEHGPVSASQIGSRARQYPALFKPRLVEGKSHIWLRRLPRRSQLVAKVVASKS